MQTDLAYFYDIQCVRIGIGSVSHLYAITARATLAKHLPEQNPGYGTDIR